MKTSATLGLSLVLAAVEPAALVITVGVVLLGIGGVAWRGRSRERAR